MLTAARTHFRDFESFFPRQPEIYVLTDVASLHQLDDLIRQPRAFHKQHWLDTSTPNHPSVNGLFPQRVLAF
jgi:hypothetical protein